jgi:hypothetical protein
LVVRQGGKKTKKTKKNIKIPQKFRKFPENSPPFLRRGIFGVVKRGG